jgi:hypothetical protein
MYLGTKSTGVSRALSQLYVLRAVAHNFWRATGSIVISFLLFFASLTKKMFYLLSSSHHGANDGDAIINLKKWFFLFF